MFQDAASGCVYIQSAILFFVVSLTKTTAVITSKYVYKYVVTISTYCLNKGIFS